MIYHLLYPLHERFGAFNVFRYITFRTAMAMLTAIVVCFILGPWLIRRLRLFQIGQGVREEGPASHQAKRGTPTMGGLLILAAVIPTTLLWVADGHPAPPAPTDEGWLLIAPEEVAHSLEAVLSSRNKKFIPLNEKAILEGARHAKQGGE